MIDIETINATEIFKDAVNKLANQNIYISNAVVKEIDTTNYTIDITINTNEIISKIPLKPINDPLRMSMFVIVPKKDSIIKVLRTANFTYPIAYEEYEYIKIGNETQYIEVKNQTTNELKIINDKIYLNTDNENEPIVKGNKNKTQLETLYGHIESLYQLIADISLSLSTATVLTLLGPQPFMPPALTTFIQKNIEATSGKAQTTVDKATTNQTLSTKNFTDN